MIGSDESAITANNTLNTLKSLEAISKKNGVPVVMHYSQNRRGQRRSDIDSEVSYVIATLAVLCSRQNDELDSRDIVNWLQYQKTTSVPAQLSILAVAANEADLLAVVNQPISIASVFSDKDQPGLNVVPDYHCAGYSKSAIVGDQAIHFAVGVDEVPLIAKTIKATLNELDEVRQSRVNRNSLVDTNDSVSDDGMVY